MQFFGDSKSRRTLKSHYWFKSDGNFAEKIEFFLLDKVVELVDGGSVIKNNDKSIWLVSSLLHLISLLIYSLIHSPFYLQENNHEKKCKKKKKREKRITNVEKPQNPKIQFLLGFSYSSGVHLISLKLGIRFTYYFFINRLHLIYNVCQV